MQESVRSRDIILSHVRDRCNIGAIVRCVRGDRDGMYHQNLCHRLNVLCDDFLLDGQDDWLRVSRACMKDETRISTDESN